MYSHNNVTDASRLSDATEDAMFNTRPATTIPDDDMFSEYVSDTTTDMENTPVNDKINDLIVEVRILNEMLAPIAPIIAALPELMSKVGPLIEGIEKSPVIKMLGIQIGKKQ